jgi:hypothetical protein
MQAMNQLAVVYLQNKQPAGNGKIKHPAGLYNQVFIYGNLRDDHNQFA